MPKKVRIEKLYFPSVSRAKIKTIKFAVGISGVPGAKGVPWIGFKTRDEATRFLEYSEYGGGLRKFKYVTRATVYFDKRRRGDIAFCVVSRIKGCLFHGDLISESKNHHYPFLFFRSYKDAQGLLAAINGHTEHVVKEVRIVFG